MSENIRNHQPNSPMQPVESGLVTGVENLPTEIASPEGALVVGATVELPPNLARMKKAERAFFGSPDELIRQIDEGELDVNDTDFEDRTAVMMMTAQGHAETVRGLIARNADVNRINMFQGRIPMSALDAARQTGRTEIEQLLLENGAKSGRELQAERIAAEQGN